MLKLERLGSQQLVQSDFKFDSVVDYISRIVDVFYAVSVARSNRLTDREYQFFIATVINLNLGIKYDEPEADYVYNTVFGKHRKYDRKDYIKKLQDKEWIEVMGGDIIIPEIFKKIDLKEDITKFNIELKIQQREDEIPD